MSIASSMFYSHRPTSCPGDGDDGNGSIPKSRRPTVAISNKPDVRAAYIYTHIFIYNYICMCISMYVYVHKYVCIHTLVLSGVYTYTVT